MLHLIFTGLCVGVGFIFAKMLIGLLLFVLAAVASIIIGLGVTAFSIRGKGRRNGAI